MIPISLGDIGKLVEGIVAAVGVYERHRTTELLAQWAELLKDSPREQEGSDKWKTKVRQFLQDRIQDNKFCPSYAYSEEVVLPEDLLTDIVDLLVAGKGQHGLLSFAWGAAAREKDRLTASEVFRYGTPEDIVELTTEWVSKRGRTRWYGEQAGIKVDKGWLADVVMCLIGA